MQFANALMGSSTHNDISTAAVKNSILSLLKDKDVIQQILQLLLELVGSLAPSLRSLVSNLLGSVELGDNLNLVEIKMDDKSPSQVQTHSTQPSTSQNA